jgi:hypothetical protein
VIATRHRARSPRAESLGRACALGFLVACNNSPTKTVDRTDARDANAPRTASSDPARKSKGTADAASDAGVCALPSMLCDGHCTDPKVDANNCGACGTVCPQGCGWGKCLTMPLAPPACDKGRCLTRLVAGEPGALAADDEALYLPGRGGLFVIEGPFDGGRQRLILSSESMVDFALGSTDVYWIDGTTGHGSSVQATPKRGGATRLVAPGPATSIAVDDASLYWSTKDAVMKTPLAGGSTVTLATEPQGARDLRVGGGHLYWRTVFPPTKKGQDEIGTIVRITTTGGTATTVASNQIVITGLAANEQGVYWTTFGNSPYDSGSVMMVSSSGGAPVTLASKQKRCTGIAVDATRVYWSTTDQSEAAHHRAADTSSVSSVPIKGGVATTLASGQATEGQNSPGFVVAIGKDAIYWVNWSTGYGTSEWIGGVVVMLRPR